MAGWVGSLVDLQRTSARHQDRAGGDLIAAAKANDLRAVRALVGMNHPREPRLRAVELNAVDRQGWAAVHFAAAEGFEEVLGLLLGQTGSCDPALQTSEGFSALMLAARNGQLGAVRLLLPRSDPDARDEDGWAAISHAVAAHQPEAVRALLQAAADVNLPAHGGQSPLWLAVAAGQHQLLEPMLAARADLFAAAGDQRHPVVAHLPADEPTERALTRHAIRLCLSHQFEPAYQCLLYADRLRAVPEPLEPGWCVLQLVTAAMQTHLGRGHDCSSRLEPIRASKDGPRGFASLACLLLAQGRFDRGEYARAVLLLEPALAEQLQAEREEWLPLGWLREWGPEGWWRKLWWLHDPVRSLLLKASALQAIGAPPGLPRSSLGAGEFAKSADVYLHAVRLRCRPVRQQLKGGRSDQLQRQCEPDLLDELCSALSSLASVMTKVPALAGQGRQMASRAVAIQQQRLPIDELQLGLALAVLEELELGQPLAPAPPEPSPASDWQSGFEQLTDLCAADPLQPGSGWQLKSDRPGVIVLAQPRPESVLVRADLQVQAPCRLVLELLLDHNRRAQWDSLFTAVSMLGSSDCDSSTTGALPCALVSPPVDEQRPSVPDEPGTSWQLVYFQLKKQWGVSQRDLCQRWWVRQPAPEGPEVYTILCEDGPAVEDPGWVRLKTIIGGYRLESDGNHTRVQTAQTRGAEPGGRSRW